MRHGTTSRSIGLALILVLLPGCVARLRERQLERVAKDWCQTIRASQVIPIYPLTEDLLPGDVFLVTTSIPRQAEVYRTRGFLPLDQHKARLSVYDPAATGAQPVPNLGYGGFYRNSHGVGDHTDTPYHWTFLSGTGDPSGSAMDDEPPAPGEGNDGRHVWPTRWWQAPAAFFPSYSFSVSSGGGINAAIPIQSVPVSLSFMQTAAANGSVQLSDPYAYGVSESEIRDRLFAWAAEHRGELAQVAARNAGTTCFLRVVNRVYLIGTIQVWLANASSGGFAGRGGAEVPDVQLIEAEPDQPPGAAAPPDAGTPGQPPAAKPATMARVLSALNDRAAGAAPGAAVKFAWATRRNVVANETFRRPLVVGFLGLDYPIQPDGGLGEAVATSQTLNGAIGEMPAIGRPDDITRDISLYTTAISTMPDAKARGLACDHAASRMPREFQAAYAAKKAETGAPYDALTSAFSSYSTTHGKTDADSDRVRRAYRAALRDSWDKFGG